MVDIGTVLEEITSEAVKLYYDYDINIFTAIEVATRIIKEKYSYTEIVEGD